MEKSTVSNSTALIALGNAGKLNILKEIYGTIYVPKAVQREVKSIKLSKNF